MRDEANERWSVKYPNAMKSWYKNWDTITPIFKYSADVRKVICTTNAIESLNAAYRRPNRQRSVFPSGTALLKALYLHAQSDKEMDSAAERLEASLLWICSNVRRQNARINLKGKNGEPTDSDRLS